MSACACYELSSWAEFSSWVLMNTEPWSQMPFSIKSIFVGLWLMDLQNFEDLIQKTGEEQLVQRVQNWQVCSQRTDEISRFWKTVPQQVSLAFQIQFFKYSVLSLHGKFLVSLQDPSLNFQFRIHFQGCLWSCWWTQYMNCIDQLGLCINWLICSFTSWFYFFFWTLMKVNEVHWSGWGWITMARQANEAPGAKMWT